MTIAENQSHEQIITNIKHGDTHDGTIMKRCSTCGKIKPIKEYNLTITGKRYQDRCNECETRSLQPKAIPKIVGQGKPLFIEGKAHQTDDLNNHFAENFNKLKEMGDTWLRDEILRKNYGEVKPADDKTYKLDKGKCKACKGEIDPKLLHHGLCPNCWTVKRELTQKERLSILFDKVKVFTDKINTEGWFTAKSMSKYFHKTYEWAYSNLVLMEKYGMVEGYTEDRRKYWRVINDG